MLRDPRARQLTARFHEQWADLEIVSRSEKDSKLFPGFAAVAPFMEEEARRFLDAAFWEGSFATLYSATHSYLNGPLAKASSATLITCPASVT